MHKSILDYFEYLDEELNIPEEKTLKFRKNVFLNESNIMKLINKKLIITIIDWKLKIKKIKFIIIKL